MSKSRQVSRKRHLTILAAVVLLALTAVATQKIIIRQVQAASTTVVISEFRVRGPNGGNDEFIELYNLTNAPINIGGWKINGSNNTAGVSTRLTITAGTNIPAHGHFLAVNNAAGGYSGSVAGDQTYSVGVTDDGGIALLNTSNTIIDQVGMSSGSAYKEGTILASLGTSNLNRGYERKPGGSSGSTTDTDNNANDFQLISPSDPQNLSSPPTPAGGTNFTLSVSLAGNGSGTITSNPAGINCGATCSASYSSGTAVTLTATANSGSTFSGWSGCDSSSGNTCNVTMTAAKSVTATFTAVQQTLNVSKTGTGGGTVTSSPAGINCGPTCSATYNNGTAVTLTATPDGSSTFTSWSGCDSSSGNTCNVTMSGTRTVTATFTSVNRTLTVSRTGTGSGTVTSSPAGITCGSTCTTTYTNGTLVTLTATPDLYATFTGWTGACSGTGTCTVTMDADKLVTANFNFTPPAIKISQVYGGGGNSGATYTNDFIELYNAGSTPVSIDGWSVQATSAAGTSWTANGAPTNLTGTIQPGHYYLVQESQGNGGTTSLPAPDASGVITMSGTNAKVALVASTAVLTGSCPLGGQVVDFVGYGSANCAEGGAATATLSNTTAALRRGNGCQDTDNNANDFVTVGPIPRNSLSPVNSCGGDPTQPSGLGIASPDSIEPAAATVLTVSVTPATTPASTGITVTADLSSIGGPPSQTFYDDGTNGDATAGDNVYSYRAVIGAATSTGAKSVVATVTDAQSRSATVPITVTVQSPTCGVERWTVKVGTDPDAGLVDLNNSVQTTITQLSALTPPPDPPGPPDNARIQPTETTLFTVYATMTLYKKETDVDYHIVLDDGSGHTMIAEIPSPACILAAGTPRTLVNSPFTQGIMNSRAKFDARFTALANFQNAGVPVRVTGVGFFDFIHGQTGVAPNGIELHPILDLEFTANTTTTIVSNANPSTYGDAVAITATVSNGTPATPTGNVDFFDGTALIGTSPLDAGGQAVFQSNSLSAGSHTITATYNGDTTSSPSTSTMLTQTVNKAASTTTVNCPVSQTFTGAAIQPCTATVTGAGGLNQSVPVTYTNNTNAGTASANATYAGDSNHDGSTGSSTFEITKAASATVVTCPPSQTYTGAAIEPCSASYSGAGNLTGTLTPTYSDNINAGTATASAAYAGDANHESSTGSATFTITKASSTTTVTCAASQTYTGTALTPCTVTVAGANLNLTPTPDYANNTNAGTATASYSFAGDANHDGSSDSKTFEIAKANANINVTPYSVTYDSNAHTANGSATGVQGESLSGLSLSGTTHKNAGTYNGDPWTFTDTTGNYNNGNGTVDDVIGQATASVSVNGYSGVYDGAAHGATGTATGVNGEDLTALLNLGETFTNVPGGTAHWTFAGNTNYATASGDAAITITKATPMITWSNPADIVYGTPLSPTQLNATANIAGSFSYTPAAGTVLNAGAAQPLLASFTPGDTTNYNSTSKNVQINVLKATPSFSNLSSPAIAYGTATTSLSGRLSFGSFNPTGSVAITLNGVTQNGNIQAGGNFSSNFATASLAPANPPYPISYNYGGDGNFNPATGSGTLTVGYGILPLYDQTKVSQSGSTIPIKLEVTDSSGANISWANLTVTAVGISLVSTSVYGPASDSGNANPDGNFRFDNGSYIFNLKTTGLGTGIYNLYFRVGNDPNLHTVQFQIK